MKNTNSQTDTTIPTIPTIPTILTNSANPIGIKKFLMDLENIGGEKEKEEFIKNYSKIREEIKIIDDILENDNIGDINDYQTQSIDTLIKLLELNENKIFGSEDMDIRELKSLANICGVLEKKINEDTLDIIEIK